MAKKKSSDVYGIIGLGRFGFPLAKKLAEAGKDVLAIDSDEEKVKKATEFTDNAFVLRDLSAESLQEVGIKNCDTVVVCIGSKIDISILTTLNVINLGVTRVISKAISADQGSILEKLGAEIVYPERDMAIRLSNRLIKSRIMEYIALSNDVEIAEIIVRSKIANVSVGELNLRKKFGLNIIALKDKQSIITEITPDLRLAENDILVVIGKIASVEEFEAFLDK